MNDCADKNRAVERQFENRFIDQFVIFVNIDFSFKTSPFQCMRDLQQHRFFVPLFVPLLSYNSPILPSYH
jgi:hypothetical protein